MPRAMFQLSGRRLVPRVPIETTCDEKLCINPAHLRKTTVARIAQRKAAAGGWTGVLRCSKIATTKRASPLAKLTIELAREIRLSDETNIVLAERHDVDPSLIQGIKAGKRWRDYSNPFAGLMA